MRTNNIMALAAHAVNNQEKLDEMFAANKRTRRDAAKKYGKQLDNHSGDLNYINSFFLGF